MSKAGSQDISTYAPGRNRVWLFGEPDLRRDVIAVKPAYCDRYFSTLHKILLKNYRMKVVISGSRSIRSLSKSVKSRLEKIISLDAEILIGDAPGVDALVMDYLVEKKYSKVTVWFVGSQPRYYRNSSWGIRRVQGNYSTRDNLMHSLADYALAIWDGKSKGTKRNIDQMNNRVRICLEV